MTRRSGSTILAIGSPLSAGAKSIRMISPASVSIIPPTAIPIPCSDTPAFAAVRRNVVVIRRDTSSASAPAGKADDVTARTLPPAVTTAALTPCGRTTTAPTGHPSSENHSGRAGLPPWTPLANGSSSSRRPSSSNG